MGAVENSPSADWATLLAHVIPCGVEGDEGWLGEITEIWSSGPVPNLVIRDGDAEQMIPFAEEFVSKVDLEAKRVTVIPPVYEE